MCRSYGVSEVADPQAVSEVVEARPPKAARVMRASFLWQEKPRKKRRALPFMGRIQPQATITSKITQRCIAPSKRLGIALTSAGGGIGLIAHVVTLLSLLSSSSVGVGTSAYAGATALIWIGGMVFFGLGSLLFRASSTDIKVSSDKY